MTTFVWTITITFTLFAVIQVLALGAKRPDDNRGHKVAHALIYFTIAIWGFVLLL